MEEGTIAIAGLMAAETSSIQANNLYQTLMLLGFGILFFYFLLWRPEQKRRKALEQQRSSLKVGDKVTAMGILGCIDSIKETSVVLKMVDGSKIEVLKMAITDVQSAIAAGKESQAPIET